MPQAGLAGPHRGEQGITKRDRADRTRSSFDRVCVPSGRGDRPTDPRTSGRAMAVGPEGRSGATSRSWRGHLLLSAAAAAPTDRRSTRTIPASRFASGHALHPVFPARPAASGPPALIGNPTSLVPRVARDTGAATGACDRRLRPSQAAARRRGRAGSRDRGTFPARDRFALRGRPGQREQARRQRIRPVHTLPARLGGAGVPTHRPWALPGGPPTGTRARHRS